MMVPAVAAVAAAAAVVGAVVGAVVAADVAVVIGAVDNPDVADVVAVVAAVLVVAAALVVAVDSRGNVVAGAPPRHAESVFSSLLHVASAMHVRMSSMQLAVRHAMHASDVSFGPQLVPPHWFTVSKAEVGTPVFGLTHGVVVVVVELVGGGKGTRVPFASLNRMQLLELHSSACFALYAKYVCHAVS